MDAAGAQQARLAAADQKPRRRLTFAFTAGLASAAVLGSGPIAAAPAAEAPSFPNAASGPQLAVWLLNHTQLGPSEIISVRPAEVIALKMVRATETKGYVATLHAEMIDPNAARDGGRLSWFAEAEVDCSARRARIRRVDDYPERNLRGTPTSAAVSGAWLTPASGTHLQAVVTAVCTGSPPRPLLAAAPTQTRPAPTISSVLAGGAPSQAKATDRPEPAEARPSSPLRQTATLTSGKPGAVETRKASLAPQTSGQLLRGASPRRYPGAVQVGASPSRALADQHLTRLRAQLGERLASLDTAISPATVDGKLYYRALVEGFSTRGEAESFCEGLRRAGEACLVR